MLETCLFIYLLLAEDYSPYNVCVEATKSEIVTYKKSLGGPSGMRLSQTNIEDEITLGQLSWPTPPHQADEMGQHSAGPIH